MSILDDEEDSFTYIPKYDSVKVIAYQHSFSHRRMQKIRYTFRLDVNTDVSKLVAGFISTLHSYDESLVDVDTKRVFKDNLDDLYSELNTLNSNRSKLFALLSYLDVREVVFEDYFGTPLHVPNTFMDMSGSKLYDVVQELHKSVKQDLDQGRDGSLGCSQYLSLSSESNYRFTQASWTALLSKYNEDHIPKHIVFMDKSGDKVFRTYD